MFAVFNRQKQIWKDKLLAMQLERETADTVRKAFAEVAPCVSGAAE